MEFFVKPKIKRLTLDNGQYIDVKRRLNTGEQHQLFAWMTPSMTAGERPQLDSKAAMTAKVLAYLVGWSFTDDGQPVPMSPDMDMVDRLATINNLDPDVFREIKDAIEAHEESVDREIEEQRKNKKGATESVAI